MVVEPLTWTVAAGGRRGRREQCADEHDGRRARASRRSTPTPLPLSTSSLPGATRCTRARAVASGFAACVERLHRRRAGRGGRGGGRVSIDRPGRELGRPAAASRTR